jgi:hypothetical protein
LASISRELIRIQVSMFLNDAKKVMPKKILGPNLMGNHARRPSRGSRPEAKSKMPSPSFFRTILTGVIRVTATKGFPGHLRRSFSAKGQEVGTRVDGLYRCVLCWAGAAPGAMTDQPI